MFEVVIPAAMQLFLDDCFWMNGRNDVEFNGPTRMGIPRKAVLEDYRIVNELGKSLNMKISVAMIIGEWDKDNLLRKVPFSNPQGEAWNRAAEIDYAYAEEIRDYVNSCEYIEIGLHGLMHDRWEDGENVLGKEYFVSTVKKRHAAWPLSLAPESHLRAHFDAFFQIYNSWSFNKPVRSFASPGGCVDTWKDDSFTKILKDYGIQFWCNNGIRDCCVSDGIIKNPKVTELVPWEAYDVDPTDLPVYPPEKIGIMGGHWVNLLRLNPKRNMERLEDWKAFFERNAQQFGVMLSRNLAFANYQLLYRRYGNISQTDACVTIDLTEADRLLPSGDLPPIYVSIRSGKDISCTGGDMSVYEQTADFVTYEIQRQPDASLITLRENLY